MEKGEKKLHKDYQQSCTEVVGRAWLVRGRPKDVGILSQTVEVFSSLQLRSDGVSVVPTGVTAAAVCSSMSCGPFWLEYLRIGEGL